MTSEYKKDIINKIDEIIDDMPIHLLHIGGVQSCNDCEECDRSFVKKLPYIDKLTLIEQAMVQIWNLALKQTKENDDS